VQSVAVIPLLSSPSDDRTRKSPLPRILAAAAVAVSLHGVLLLGQGAGVTSTSVPSQSLAIRLIETSAQQTATVVPEPSAVSTAKLVRPDADTRSGREGRPPGEGATGKPARPQRPAETPVVSGSTQPVTPLAPTSPKSSAGPSARALADAPDYLPANLLSVRPRPLQDIEPEYPEAADLRSGKVVLRLLIGDTGHVDDVAVVRANPPGLFDASALEAFSKALFSPGLANGIAVKSQMMVEVEFVPLNRLSRISGRSY